MIARQCQPAEQAQRARWRRRRDRRSSRSADAAAGARGRACRPGCRRTSSAARHTMTSTSAAGVNRASQYDRPGAGHGRQGQQRQGVGADTQAGIRCASQTNVRFSSEFRTLCCSLTASAVGCCRSTMGKWLACRLLPGNASNGGRTAHRRVRKRREPVPARVWRIEDREALRRWHIRVASQSRRGRGRCW